MARLMAAEAVIRDLILLTPEPDAPGADADADQGPGLGAGEWVTVYPDEDSD